MPLYHLAANKRPAFISFFNRHAINGELNHLIIRGILEKCGHSPTDGEVQQVIDSVSVTRTGINLQGFMDFISSYQELRNPDSEFKSAFRIYDTKGDGNLSKADVVMMFAQMHVDIDVEKLFEEADSNKDGSIDFEEFCNLMAKE